MRLNRPQTGARGSGAIGISVCSAHSRSRNPLPVRRPLGQVGDHDCVCVCAGLRSVGEALLQKGAQVEHVEFIQQVAVARPHIQRSEAPMAAAKEEKRGKPLPPLPPQKFASLQF